jgi:hypothetical protein
LEAFLGRRAVIPPREEKGSHDLSVLIFGNGVPARSYVSLRLPLHMSFLWSMMKINHCGIEPQFEFEHEKGLKVYHMPA